EDETARLWDTATGKLLRSWEGHESAVRKVRFRDGGTKVFTRTVGGMERIWSAQDGSKLSERRTTGSRYNRFGVLFLKDDNHHVEVWAGPPGAPGEEASGPQQRLALRSSLIGHSASRAVAVSPDGKLIVTVGRGNTLLLWDPARWDKVTGRGRVRLGAFTKSIESLAFGPAGRTLAVGTEEGIVSLWDVFAKRQTFRLSAHAGAVKGLAFSPDGRVLASGGEDRAVILWNVRTGKPQLTITGRTGAIRCLAFSPNGQLLASGGTIRDWTDKERNEFYRPGEVKLWDTKTGKELATLRGYGATVTCLGFTPDGRTLAAASDDKTLRLWDLATCKQQALLRGDDECFSSLAFSPDGKLLASGHYWTKGSVELWDVHDRSEICRFVPHAYTVYQLAFTPDCKTLISGSNDGTVKFWDVHTVCQRKRSK
ncbi:MAG TPA: WD40 repeat domain-containing protein, partial [Gemmataceae bacterium]|nr:WD40 repeat domain-containing protein [Gemmataceae bacterium]